MRSGTILWLTLVVLLAACQASDGGTTTEPGPGSSTPDTGGPTTMPSDEDTTTSLQGGVPSDTVLAAIEDLAARLDVDQRRIRLISSEEVTWPDGSLGCPQPGRSYTQATVDGYRVVLNHEDRAFDYHVGPDGSPFLCPTDAKDGGYHIIPPPGFDE